MTRRVHSPHTQALARRVIWLVALLCAAFPARAEDFYHDKTLTMIVGFAPGGGIDTSARIFARHYARLIPGAPNIVIQTIDGAAGLLAANYLEKRASADGLTIAVPGRSWFIEPMLKNPNAQFDPLKFAYIGSTGAMNSFLWVSAASGLKSIEDIKKSASPVVFGALGAGTQTAIVGAILAESGMPIKMVTGYPGSSRLLLALQQGEAQVVFLTEDSFLLHRDLIAQGKVIAVLQSRLLEPSIPLLGDYVPDRARAVLELAQAGESLGMIVAAPAAVPLNRLTILRDAFLATMGDVNYRAEASKLAAQTSKPLDAEAVAHAVKMLSESATAEVVTAFNRLRK